MKKLTVASLFALSAVAASAQTSIYGQVGVFADSAKNGTASSVQTMQDNFSRLGISVQEKVSKGLSVSAVIESSLAADDPAVGASTRLGDRQSTLGVRTDNLSVDVGRKFHSHYLNVSSADPFSAFYFATGSDIHPGRGFRLGEAAFVEFKPAKNVTLVAERTLSGATEATVLGGSTKLLGVEAGLTQFKQGSEKSTGLSLRTTLAKATLSYAASDNKGVSPSRGHSVGVSYPMGSFQLNGAYGKTNTDVTAWNVGVDYNLSKRTSLHAAYRDVDRAGKALDSSQYVVGMIHRF